MRIALALLVLAGACKKDDAEPAPPPPPPEPGVAATLDGQAVRLISGTAVASDRHGVVGLTFYLSVRDETCASIRTSDAPALELFVPSGPGDAYFVGHEIHVPANSRRGEYEGLPGARPQEVRLTVEHVDAHAAGIAVDLQWGTGPRLQVNGRFDVVVCDPPPRAGLPTEAPTGPAAGDYTDNGTPGTFAFGTVHAMVEQGAIARIDLLEDPGVPCGEVSRTQQLHTWVPLAAAHDTPHPASMSVVSGDMMIGDDWNIPGWVRLDDSTPSEATLSVVFRRDTGKAGSGHLAGVLHAKLCPM